jgi:hypothetical protein
MNIALWIAQVLLAGSMKTMQVAKVREMMPWSKGRSDGYVRFVGTSELLGALGMILPILTGILAWLTPMAAIGLSIIQLLAIFHEHLRRARQIESMQLPHITLQGTLGANWGSAVKIIG